MNKILILDDGTNIKAYSELENSYVKVGDYPPTLDMFETFGNEELFGRTGLVLENPTVMVYTPNETKVKIKSKVMPKYKTVILKKSENIAGEGVKNIEVNYEKSETAEIKFAFSNDDKKTYYTFNIEKRIWEAININNEDSFLEKGLKCEEISKITQDEFKLIFTKDKMINFAIIMNKVNTDDLCNIKSVKINYII